jgi:hypothetical protein
MTTVYIIAWEGKDQSGFGYDWYWNESIADTCFESTKLWADPHFNVWQTSLEVDVDPGMSEATRRVVEPLIEGHLTKIMKGTPTFSGGSDGPE